MSASHAQPTADRRRRPAGLAPAIAWYAAMGLFGLALAAWFVLSLVEMVAAGYCESGGGVVCGHYLPDLIAPSIAAVVAATLLPTAWRLRRDPPQYGWTSAAGASVGVLIALLPHVLIVFAGGDEGTINIFGSKTPVPVLLAIFALPLLWALTSAFTVWREAARQRKLGVHLLAAAAAALLGAAGVVLLMTGATASGATDDDLIHSLGTGRLQLEEPVLSEVEDEVHCIQRPNGEIQVNLDMLDEQPEPGQPAFTVTVTVGEGLAVGLERREDGLEVLIEIHHADREPDQLTATQASRLELERDGSSGSINFAGLSRTTYGDAGPGLAPSDVEGTFEWSCSG